MKKSSQIFGVLIILLFCSLFQVSVFSVHAGEEVKELRTLNSRTYRNDDGSYTARFYCGHINYLDENTGEFEEIDTTIIEGIDRNYEMLKACYNVKLSPGLEEDEYPIQFIAREQTLSFIPRGIFWRNEAGEEELISLVNKVDKTEVAGNTLIYPGAFGEGIDLEIVCNEDGIAKVVVFNTPEVLPEPGIADAYLAIEYEWKLAEAVSLTTDLDRLYDPTSCLASC